MGKRNARGFVNEVANALVVSGGLEDATKEVGFKGEMGLIWVGREHKN